jgi:uncharacterized damage-inducible protein DinB
MDANDVRRLYDYTDWANERMLGAIAGLSDEQFARDIVSSYRSIRDTLAHIAVAEFLWLRRWMGESPPREPEWMTGQSFDELRRKLHDIAAERRSYLSSLANADVEVTLHYRSVKGDAFALPLGDTLIHCANHSTYHRGQLVTMLRQVGATPPNMDYSVFARS